MTAWILLNTQAKDLHKVFFFFFQNVLVFFLFLHKKAYIVAMHAASQLPGRGPTDVDVAPVPAC